jgi:hypothetical protein
MNSTSAAHKQASRTIAIPFLIWGSTAKQTMIIVVVEVRHVTILMT